jgi:hypothetical protein
MLGWLKAVGEPLRNVKELLETYSAILLVSWRDLGRKLSSKKKQGEPLSLLTSMSFSHLSDILRSLLLKLLMLIKYVKDATEKYFLKH